MKIEPTEALRLLRETKHNPTHDIPKYKADIIARVAFSEGQSSPKIKQLEWEEYENRLGRKSYLSKTQFSSYEVADGGEPHYVVYDEEGNEFYDSNENCKYDLSTFGGIIRYAEDRGYKMGYLSCQMDMRKVLGIS